MSQSPSPSQSTSQSTSSLRSRSLAVVVAPRYATVQAAFKKLRCLSETPRPESSRVSAPVCRSLLPPFSLRPIERSTKRAINRLTSSRACPEYCPSMGPTCARVERSSFFSLYFGAVFLPPSPLFSAHPLCNIRSTKGKNKKNGNGNLS